MCIYVNILFFYPVLFTAPYTLYIHPAIIGQCSSFTNNMQFAAMNATWAELDSF